ncbi:MAG TPA: alcohol dehydrogenase catalytic domain-containing protein, partial [Xanthomonadales bacterium]|nr:alcohol dehydrogenase catalytic domain-containing protein [Xanthomonadales bacterium]
MARRRFTRILRNLAIVAVALLVPAAIVLSWDSACAAPPAAPSGTALMKAVVQRCYGATDVLAIEDVAKPVPADGEVLVRVHAAATNPLDWHYMHGTPYVMRMSAGIGRPKVERFGVDFAGTVEAVGKSVTAFAPGDEVFGGRTGAFAEYVVVRADRNVVKKPSNVT